MSILTFVMGLASLPLSLLFSTIRKIYHISLAQITYNLDPCR